MSIEPRRAPLAFVFQRRGGARDCMSAGQMGIGVPVPSNPASAAPLKNKKGSLRARLTINMPPLRGLGPGNLPNHFPFHSKQRRTPGGDVSICRSNGDGDLIENLLMTILLVSAALAMDARSRFVQNFKLNNGGSVVVPPTHKQTTSAIDSSSLHLQHESVE